MPPPPFEHAGARDAVRGDLGQGGAGRRGALQAHRGGDQARLRPVRGGDAWGGVLMCELSTESASEVSRGLRSQCGRWVEVSVRASHSAQTQVLELILES